MYNRKNLPRRGLLIFVAFMLLLGSSGISAAYRATESHSEVRNYLAGVHPHPPGKNSSNEVPVNYVPTAATAGSAHSELSEAAPHIHPMERAAGGASSANSLAPLQPPNYDEQIGITFTQSFTSLSYNVTAVEQSDQDGYGPAYLLNGLTDQGYWYQVGLSYDWPYQAGGSDFGFNFNYEAFNSTGKSVFPANGGGLEPYSSAVNQGDIVLLNLYFSGGEVNMYSKDWNTSATAYVTFSDEGASSFVGLPDSSNSNGYFSGLMTEEYHASTYYASESKATYSDPTFQISSATMWIDEYNVNTSQVYFGQSSSEVSYSNPNLFQTFSLDGATEQSNSYALITGSVVQDAVTMNYTVDNGGFAYTTPTLLYFSNGYPVNVSLSPTPTLYFMDSGSSWTVTNPLTGSTSTERWFTNQSQGTSSPNLIVDLVYVNQYQVTLQANPANAGTTVPSTASWVPAGTQINIGEQATSPYFFENWNSSVVGISFGDARSSSTNATISAPGTIFANFATIALSLRVDSGTVTQGASKSFAAIVVGNNGTGSLSVSGLPSGTTLTFVSNNLPLVQSGTTDSFNISASLSTQPGTYPITITITSGGSNSSAVFELRIKQEIALSLEFITSDNSSAAQPVLNFTYNGLPISAPLTETANIYYVDAGSNWTVQRHLSSSDANERWISNQTVGGNATTPVSETVVYYHQYYVNFGFKTGGGTIMQSPGIALVSFGSPSSINTTASGSPAWVDAGSAYSFETSVNSSPAQRWMIVSNQTGMISTSGSMNAKYQQQFLVGVNFEVSGGGSGFAAPSIRYQNLGSSSNFTLQLNQNQIWMDAGSTWSAPSLLPKSSGVERWTVENSTNSGTIGSPSSILLDYGNQYFVTIDRNSPDGGSILPSNGWHDANSSLLLSATANPNWEFVSWHGNGLISSNASAPGNAVLQVTSPANETAEFAAGLTISAGSNGQLSYNFGSNQGSVSEGSSETVYVTPGTTVTLDASPSSAFYTVSGWSSGKDSAPAGASYSLVVSSPTTLAVSFGYNVAIIGIIGVIVAAAIASALLIFRKRGHKES